MAVTWRQLTPPVGRDCTWAKCTRGAAFERLDANGVVWASLCVDHQEQFEQAIDCQRRDYTPQGLVSAWIKAQGGAEKAHMRTFGPFARILRTDRQRREELEARRGTE